MRDKILLRQLQSLPLQAKITMAEQRIREWYEALNGMVYISFSGGKDSTVLADLVHGMYPEVPLVFANTGLEYPEIQKFARDKGAEFIRPKMSFSEVISAYGYPIISKEVAEAIHYARKIVFNDQKYCGGGVQLQKQTHFKRTEMFGRRTDAHARTQTDRTAWMQGRHWQDLRKAEQDGAGRTSQGQCQDPKNRGGGGV